MRSLSVHSQPHREPVERTEHEDKGQMTIQPERPGDDFGGRVGQNPSEHMQELGCQLPKTSRSCHRK